MGTAEKEQRRRNFGWRRCIGQVVACVLLGAFSANAWISSSPLPTHSSNWNRRSSQYGGRSSPFSSSSPAEASSLAPPPSARVATALPPLYGTSGVVGEDLEGREVWLNFAAFGFGNRTCQLSLMADGECAYSEGMISTENGNWRIEEEEGVDYLQFSCPLTELYSEVFDIPSALVFWRAPLSKPRDTDADGAKLVTLADGVIISEKKSLFGLKTDFVQEGTFSGRTLAKGESFPKEPKSRILDVLGDADLKLDDVTKVGVGSGGGQTSAGVSKKRRKGALAEELDPDSVGPKVREPPTPKTPLMVDEYDALSDVRERDFDE